MVAYADDSQIVVDAKNVTQLQKKIAQNWYLGNTMKNNLGKTEILVLSQGKNTQNMKILIEDVEKVTIKTKASIKILGHCRRQAEME